MRVFVCPSENLAVSFSMLHFIMFLPVPHRRANHRDPTPNCLRLRSFLKTLNFRCNRKHFGPHFVGNPSFSACSSFFRPGKRCEKLSSLSFSFCLSPFPFPFFLGAFSRFLCVFVAFDVACTFFFHTDNLVFFFAFVLRRKTPLGVPATCLALSLLPSLSIPHLPSRSVSHFFLVIFISSR